MKRDLLIFVAGLAIGATVTFFVVKKKYEVLAQEEIDSVKDTFSRGHRRESGAIDEASDDPANSFREELRDIRGNAGYQKLIRHYDKGGAVTMLPIDTNVPTESPVDSDEDEGPQIISFEEFNEGCPMYDKTSLTYYVADETLADAEDDFADVNGLVGPDALNNFGYMSEDPNVVYVRNHNLSTDFEISRVESSYAEMIGLPQDGEGDDE